MEAGTKQFIGCLPTTIVFYPESMRLLKGEGYLSESQYLKKVKSIKDARND